MPMMSDRASSFPPVKTSWMRVAQRTLELFTQVRSTGEESGGVGGRLRPHPPVGTAKSSLSCPQEDGIPCSYQSASPLSEAHLSGLAAGGVPSPPTQGRQQRPSPVPGGHSLRQAMESTREAAAGGMQLGNTGCST